MLRYEHVSIHSGVYLLCLRCPIPLSQLCKMEVHREKNALSYPPSSIYPEMSIFSSFLLRVRAFKGQSCLALVDKYGHRYYCCAQALSDLCNCEKCHKSDAPACENHRAGHSLAYL